LRNTGSITAAASAIRSDEIRRLLVMGALAITEAFPPHGPFTIQGSQSFAERIRALRDLYSNAYCCAGTSQMKMRPTRGLRAIRNLTVLVQFPSSRPSGSYQKKHHAPSLIHVEIGIVSLHSTEVNFLP
jgi:hypothetical protein